jgi:hypothetical protein
LEACGTAAVVQRLAQDQGEEGAEDMAADGGIWGLENGPGAQNCQSARKIDEVDDARSRHPWCHRVIVEERIT